MEFSEKNLQYAADKGSEKAACAFSGIANTKVQVATSKVKFIPYKELIGNMNLLKEDSIVVYAQAMIGEGVSLLTISRENAFTLVDLLNQQPIGTTGILRDIDRSAIKETLNILSNSYVVALADNANIEIAIDVPFMITSNRLNDVLRMSLENIEDGKEVAMFESSLAISQYELKASLYIIFNKDLINLLKSDK